MDFSSYEVWPFFWGEVGTTILQLMWIYVNMYVCVTSSGGHRKRQQVDVSTRVGTAKFCRLNGVDL